MKRLRTAETQRWGAFARLSILPTLILAAAVVFTMVLVAWVFAAAHNLDAIKAETERVKAALANEQARFFGMVERAFERPLDRDRFSATGARLSQARLGDVFALVTADAGIAATEPAMAGLNIATIRVLRDLASSTRLRSESGGIIAATRETGLVLIDGAPASVALLPDSRNGTLLVALHFWDEDTRARIATSAGVEDLMPPAKPGPRTLSVPDARFGAPVVLSWSSPDHGIEVAARLTSIGVLGLLVIALNAILAVRHVRKRATELARRAADAQYTAGHDALSGLPNRSLFAERLASALARRASKNITVAVMLLDLDRFKEVNDTFGHAAGDALIVEFGQRVHGLLRGVDTIARLGGDEFAVIQVGISSYRDAETLARSILRAAAEPFEFQGARAEIGVSIGIALAPENGVQTSALLRAADAALYRSKSEGRNRFSFYGEHLDEAEKTRKLVEDELRGAIERDELVLHYQPQIAAESGKIAGVEALVRWNHPKRGMIPPAIFISTAEERGLVGPLGEWVMRRACLDAARWPGLSIAVNVSPVQFRHRDFVAMVAQILAETGLDPGRLELEITEGVLIENAEEAELAIIALQAIGVRLALDDFGTGYSSLIYLRRFAFDKIKMDKSFLEAMETTGESAILVHSVVHLGRALGLEVTAEGVETREQFRFLQAVGCHYVQGFMFSRGVPADEIDAMVAEGATPLGGGALTPFQAA